MKNYELRSIDAEIVELEARVSLKQEISACHHTLFRYLLQEEL